jgi:type IV fimbrial biogenesis protein FimT
MKVYRGLTLLELMIAIAVLAILFTVGIPAIQDLIQNNRLRTQTNALVSALEFARSEAGKQGRNVELVVIAADSGWSATVRLSNVDAPPLREVVRPGSGITASGGTVVFGPSGAPMADVTFEMRPATNCTGDKIRRIAVAPTGEITTTREACE